MSDWGTPMEQVQSRIGTRKLQNKNNCIMLLVIRNTI